MKKYFFFDIDGTLTDLKTHQIVQSAKIALEKLKQAGHFVCLNTGRAHYKAEKARLEFNFEHMICNGGNGIVLDGKLVENIPLDKQGALKIIEEAETNGCPPSKLAAAICKLIEKKNPPFRTLTGPWTQVAFARFKGWIPGKVIRYALRSFYEIK